MSLEDVIEETKKKLAELGEEAPVEDQELEEDPGEDEQEIEGQEDATEEGDQEEEKEPVKPKEEKPDPEDSGKFAKLRRDNAALKRKLEELEAQRLQPEPQPQKEGAESAQVDLPPEISRVVERERYEAAGREFTNLENEFKQTVPDYDGIATAYKMEMYRGIRFQNPSLSHDEILERTNKSILLKAGQYAAQGYNAAEEIYHEAVQLGLKPVSLEQQEEPKPDLTRRNMENVSRNRQRSASFAGAKGNGGQGQLTLQSAANLTAAEWSRLSPAEKKRLLPNL